jgi:hypothetical protein
MRNLNSNECKGCNYILLDKKIDIKCMIKYEKELLQTCPCKTCIVKSMCSKMCIKRYNLYHDLSNEIRDQIWNKIYSLQDMK